LPYYATLCTLSLMVERTHLEAPFEVWDGCLCIGCNHCNFSTTACIENLLHVHRLLLLLLLSTKPAPLVSSHVLPQPPPPTHHHPQILP
jgi:hypothetical protein